MNEPARGQGADGASDDGAAGSGNSRIGFFRRGSKDRAAEKARAEKLSQLLKVGWAPPELEVRFRGEVQPLAEHLAQLNAPDLALYADVRNHSTWQRGQRAACGVKVGGGAR